MTVQARHSTGPCPLIFLTLILLAAGLAQIIRPPNSSQNFVSEHVDFPKTRPHSGQTYCNYMMWCLSQKIHMCKLTHTFIHAPTSRLWAICTSRGGRYNQYNECDSFTAYLLTTCLVHSPLPTELCLQGNTPDPQDPRGL
uniref:Ribonuclease A-domain domain-containing protein n=1 Tax=Chelonoidis abingdonii TaxID=106734 RepID=A0A8C0GXA6_CHEAB